MIQDMYTRPVTVKVTNYVAENVKKLLWNIMMDEDLGNSPFNQGALKLLLSRFEFLSGEDDGDGFSVTFQIHELVSFVHFVDAMLAFDKLTGSHDVAHRTKELKNQAVQEVIMNLAPVAARKAIGAVDGLYLDRDQRKALEEKLRDGGARALNWEYKINNVQAESLRLQFDLFVDIDPELYAHTQVSPIEIEVK